MIRRCTNPNDATYQRYGAKGISVCERWRDFAAFLADMGERPSGRTLDRVDNHRNYEPGNCRWSTVAEQNANRTVNIMITIGEETMPAAAWARRCGLTDTIIRKRWRKGVRGEALLHRFTNEEMITAVRAANERKRVRNEEKRRLARAAEDLR